MPGIPTFCALTPDEIDDICAGIINICEQMNWTYADYDVRNFVERHLNGFVSPKHDRQVLATDYRQYYLDQ